MSVNNKNKNRRTKKQYNEREEMELNNFASATLSVGRKAKSGSRNVSESTLKSMLENPARNAIAIAEYSSSLKGINGIYKQIIEYVSSSLTFDHTIFPVIENPFEAIQKPEDLQVAFTNNAIFMERLKPKFHLPIFTDKIFTHGALFLYKIEDSKNVAYLELPLEICRISYIEDGVYRYQIDLSRIKEEAIESLPPEIQKGFNSFKSGNKDKFEDGKWLQITDRGVAFTLDTDVLHQEGLSIPPLASSLVDVLKIESSKSEMDDVNELDNTKIVHSQIETDDKGRPTMEFKAVKKYHDNLKRALPAGSVAITNPFKTSAMTLSGTGKDGKFALLNRTMDGLYESSGKSKLLFSGDGASSQALERTIQVDNQYLYNFLLPMFENYYDYELRKVNKKGTYWKCKFLPVSYFSRSDAIKMAKDQLSYGGSRTEYLAYTGMTPIEVANVLVYEQQVLAIDNIMVAKQNSHTMSSKDSNNSEKGEVGAPKSENPTDDTVRIKDSK